MVSSVRPNLLRYWGKASRDKNDSLYHPLAYHSLDVAAVGHVFLQYDKNLRQRLNHCSSLESDDLLALVNFFLAIHDLGKFSESFQNINPDLFKTLRGYPSNEDYTKRHDSLGFLLWEKEILPKGLQEGWLGLGNPEDDEDDWHDILKPWSSAVTGHHGAPPKAEFNCPTKTYFDPDTLNDAIDFCKLAAKMFLPISLRERITLSDYEIRKKSSETFSWYLAGLAVLCDWLGSDQTHFPYQTTGMPLADYWERYAIPQAKKAVNESGILPSSPHPKTGLKQLFPDLEQPTPTQHFISQCKLSTGPHLFIIEDLTGSGKTEAALILAHRMMVEGAASGVFLALPTMATADAMYERLGETYKRLFAESERPSLNLVHGSKNLSKAFRSSIETGRRNPDRSYSRDEESASVYCAAWLADNRKKALLADVGAGTVDQVLLAVLPCKHQSLRLFGLGRSILIVDEVHAYDSYMNRLLCALLEFHAAQGGSAILLSATLPQKTRQELIGAYKRGLRQEPARLTDNSYPLVTHVSPDSFFEEPVGSRKENARKFTVEFVSSETEALDRLTQAANEGKCACWIRNTVADAMTAYNLLAEKYSKDNLILFHARFAMGDRLEIEGKVQSYFGKKSSATDRRGKILVATQVVEQSLDLDFDVMVTDLAPIDLLIQRSGRLNRHHRDEEGNPLEGRGDRRGPIILTILSPSLADVPDANWFKSVFPKAAHIYPHHGQLWRGAQLLASRKIIALPEDARDLIEGVYGENAAEHIPIVFQGIENKAEGKDSSEASLGRLNALKLSEGYQRTWSHWLEDAETPTRLGDASTTLRLARWDGETLIPWADDPDYPWDKSQVSINRFYAVEESLPSDPRLKQAIEDAKESMPDGGKWSLLVPMTTSDGVTWNGTVLNEKGLEIKLTYHRETGLTTERKGETP